MLWCLQHTPRSFFVVCDWILYFFHWCMWLLHLQWTCVGDWSFFFFQFWFKYVIFYNQLFTIYWYPLIAYLMPVGRVNVLQFCLGWHFQFISGTIHHLWLNLYTFSCMRCKQHHHWIHPNRMITASSYRVWLHQDRWCSRGVVGRVYLSRTIPMRSIWTPVLFFLFLLDFVLFDFWIFH